METATELRAPANLLPSATPILEVENLQVRYGNFTAVEEISFSLFGGEILGLLGPNGAGKTSSLSAIEGLLKPEKGQIIIAGYNTKDKPLQARVNMGVQLQATSFQPELTVEEILNLYAGVYGVALSKEKLSNVLAEINLKDASSKRFGQLSGGQQQRISLAIATLHQPALVLLDEPTTGLDPQSRRQLWDRIENMRSRGHGILLTTHSMEEAESVCDRIVIIDHGRIVDVGTPETIVEKHRNNPEVIRASRKGRITLEDVFIGLTGTRIRS
jgi:ABC-2 type transport system ATP-binding protein